MLDVNVLVSAHHRESPEHVAFRKWLQGLIAAGETFGVPEIVLSGFVRVVTLPRPWQRPSTTVEALNFCELLMSLPQCLVLQPSGRHWNLFGQLCRRINAKANLVSDAYLAVFALEQDAEWVTGDVDFAKFPGLRWRRLPQDQVVTNPR